MIAKGLTWSYGEDDEKVYIEPESLAYRLWHAYCERKRLAGMGYTTDLSRESTLLTDAFLVIDEEIERHTRPAKKTDNPTS